MGAMDVLWRILSLAPLERTRALLRQRRARLVAAAIAFVYIVVSMVVGQMLTFPGFGGPLFVTVQWTGSPWWDFPELFVFNAGVALDLFFLPTLTMIFVSAGVGIGGAAALTTVVPWLRGSSRPAGREAATPSAAGASAAISGLATLGACCCTTCVGAAGVAVVAAASGTDAAVLLLQNWYLDLFQLVIVGVALLAQERALRLPSDTCRVAPKVDRRFVLGALLRIALLLAGLTWSLAMFVEWVETPPSLAGAATWYHWIVEHQLLAMAAVVAGLFPQETAAAVRSLWSRPAGWGVRAALLVGGVTWGIGVPAFATGLGLGGLLNEALGWFGAPAAWGAIGPEAALGPALAFHWLFQHLLLAIFAVLLALRPRVALSPLVRTVAGIAPGPVPEATPSADS